MKKTSPFSSRSGHWFSFLQSIKFLNQHLIFLFHFHFYFQISRLFEFISFFLLKNIFSTTFFFTSVSIHFCSFSLSLYYFFIPKLKFCRRKREKRLLWSTDVIGRNDLQYPRNTSDCYSNFEMYVHLNDKTRNVTILTSDWIE